MCKKSSNFIYPKQDNAHLKRESTAWKNGERTSKLVVDSVKHHLMFIIIYSCCAFRRKVLNPWTRLSPEISVNTRVCPFTGLRPHQGRKSNSLENWVCGNSALIHLLSLPCFKELCTFTSEFRIWSLLFIQGLEWGTETDIKLPDWSQSWYFPWSWSGGDGRERRWL